MTEHDSSNAVLRVLTGLAQQREAVMRIPEGSPPLASGGLDENLTGEARQRVANLIGIIESLERNMGELLTSMRRLQEQVIEIEAASNSKPGKGFLIALFLISATAISLVTVFPEVVQTFGNDARLLIRTVFEGWNSG